MSVETTSTSSGVDIIYPRYMSKSVIAGADFSFYAKTLAYYLDARNAELVKYLEAAQEYESEVDRSLDEETALKTPEQFLEELGLVNAAIPCGNGYVTAVELLNAVKRERETFEEQAVSLMLSDKSASGVKATVGEIGEYLMNTYSSSLVHSELLKVVEEGNSLSDRLSLLQDRVGQVLNSSDDIVSSSLAMAREYLSAGADSAAVLKGLGDNLGYTNHTDEVTFPNNNKVFDMTGASPVGALDFSNVNNAVQSVCNVGAKVVGSIFNAIGSFISWGFGKIIDGFKDVFIDPHDIEFMSNAGQGSNVSEDLCWTEDVSGSAKDKLQLFIVDGPEVDNFNDFAAHVYDEVSKRKSFIYQSTFFEVILQPKGSWPTCSMLGYEEGTNGGKVKSVWFPAPAAGGLKVVYRPRMFNPERLKQLIYQVFGSVVTPTETDPLGIQTNIEYTDEQLQQFSVLCEEDSALWEIKNLSEIDCYRALYFCNEFADLWAWDAMQSDHWFDVRPSHRIPAGSLFVNKDLVTNSDFAYLLSGWNGSTFAPVFRESTYSSKEIDPNRPSPALAVLCMCYCSAMERVLYSLEFGFYPYSESTNDISKAGFRVRTDAMNKERANNIITAVIVAVIVIAAAVTAGVVVRKVALKLARRRESIIATTQAKLWSGEKLTNKEWRKYQRASKKGGISSLWSEKTVNPSSSGSENSQNSKILQESNDAIVDTKTTLLVPIDNIIHLITGPVEN